MKKTIRLPRGWRIVLDSEQIFPDDPGNGTPALVIKGNYSATYDCALQTGEAIANKPGIAEVILLPSEVVAALDSDAVFRQVDTFINGDVVDQIERFAKGEF